MEVSISQVSEEFQSTGGGCGRIEVELRLAMVGLAWIGNNSSFGMAACFFFFFFLSPPGFLRYMVLGDIMGELHGRILVVVEGVVSVPKLLTSMP